MSIASVIDSQLTKLSLNGTDVLASGLAIGQGAGLVSQDISAVAIGIEAGQSTQGINAVAIGTRAGQVAQSDSAVAIGYQAGQLSQGALAIAIGQNAGATQQHAATIVLDATNGTIATEGTLRCYIGPIRAASGVPAGFKPLLWNPTTREVYCNNA